MLFCFSTLSCNRNCLSVTEETVGQIKAFGLKQDTWGIQVLLLRNLKSQKSYSRAKNQRDTSINIGHHEEGDRLCAGRDLTAHVADQA
jgi:hypothetical protein